MVRIGPPWICPRSLVPASALAQDDGAARAVSLEAAEAMGGLERLRDHPLPALLEALDAETRLGPVSTEDGAIVVQFTPEGATSPAGSASIPIATFRSFRAGSLAATIWRPAVHYADALARNPQALVLTPVDARLVLEDATRRLELYHASNTPTWPMPCSLVCLPTGS